MNGESSRPDKPSPTPPPAGATERVARQTAAGRAFLDRYRKTFEALGK